MSCSSNSGLHFVAFWIKSDTSLQVIEGWEFLHGAKIAFLLFYKKKLV